MVAGLADVIEGQPTFGCGGPQRSELFSAAFQLGTDPGRSMASVQGRRFGDYFGVADPSRIGVIARDENSPDAVSV